MDIHGQLEERDTLRLLRTLRFARKNLGENAHVVVSEPEVSGVIVQLTVGNFIDQVLDEYKDLE